MADKLKEAVDTATRGQIRAARPRVSDIGRTNTKGKYQADIAAAQADMEDRVAGFARGGKVLNQKFYSKGR